MSVKEAKGMKTQEWPLVFDGKFIREARRYITEAMTISLVVSNSQDFSSKDIQVTVETEPRDLYNHGLQPRAVPSSWYHGYLRGLHPVLVCYVSVLLVLTTCKYVSTSSTMPKGKTQVPLPNSHTDEVISRMSTLPFASLPFQSILSPLYQH
ncbi:Hypothetical predicted protein [Marmota monax]|uniref:Uncharacterized protein n=1 Tax=Marmota monax TaxID=9995 RepID=A0A5E4AGF3_MARMO|nr:hypothetical protein GHT09_019564 [Marmota monax]VTJ56328.1 Hypothetical predicted protein [Marmota monax]